MPNLYSKLISGASNIANRAEDAVMPAPAQGLFDQKDIDAARRQGLLHLGLSLLGDTSGNGLGSALKEGVAEGQGAYGESLANNIAQNTALKQKNLLETRKAIGAKYAPQPGDTMQQVFARYPQMYMDYMRAGDMEAAKNVEAIVSQQIAKENDNKLQAIPGFTFNQQTGTYTPAPQAPLTQYQRAEIAEHQAATAASLENARASRALREQAQNQQAANAFINQNTKGVIDREPLYQNWIGAYKSAKSANPTDRQVANHSAIVNFGRFADPGQRSSLGILQYMQQVMPSVVGKAHMTVERLESGDIPDYVLDAMLRHAQSLRKQTVGLYDTKREQRIKANPALEGLIPPTSTVFPEDPIDVTSPTGDRVNRFFQGWGR